jgi:hypothetical protein
VEPEANRAPPPPDNSIIDTTVERSEAVHKAATQEEFVSHIEGPREPASTPNETAGIQPERIEPARIEPTSKRDWL